MYYSAAKSDQILNAQNKATEYSTFFDIFQLIVYDTRFNKYIRPS